jgi:hypothetical protein
VGSVRAGCGGAPQRRVDQIRAHHREDGQRHRDHRDEGQEPADDPAAGPGRLVEARGQVDGRIAGRDRVGRGSGGRRLPWPEAARRVPQRHLVPRQLLLLRRDPRRQGRRRGPEVEGPVRRQGRLLVAELVLEAGQRRVEVRVEIGGGGRVPARRRVPLEGRRGAERRVGGDRLRGVDRRLRLEVRQHVVEPLVDGGRGLRGPVRPQPGGGNRRRRDGALLAALGRRRLDLLDPREQVVELSVEARVGGGVAVAALRRRRVLAGLPDHAGQHPPGRRAVERHERRLEVVTETDQPPTVPRASLDELGQGAGDPRAGRREERPQELDHGARRVRLPGGVRRREDPDRAVLGDPDVDGPHRRGTRAHRLRHLEGHEGADLRGQAELAELQGAGEVRDRHAEQAAHPGASGGRIGTPRATR